MTRRLNLIILVACLMNVASVHAGKQGELNPAAPPETNQFSFIIGNWACKTRFMGPDGSFTESEASWNGYYTLDGWAIKDDWRSTLPDGRPFHGFNIRSYNPQTGKWDNRWLPQYSMQWKHFESEMIGDTMVMIGGNGTDQRGEFIDRNTFFEITENSWRWRKDRSYDGGETWAEGVGFIDATRIRE